MWGLIVVDVARSSAFWRDALFPEGANIKTGGNSVPDHRAPLRGLSQHLEGAKKGEHLSWCYLL